MSDNVHYDYAPLSRSGAGCMRYHNAPNVKEIEKFLGVDKVLFVRFEDESKVVEWSGLIIENGDKKAAIYVKDRMIEKLELMDKLEPQSIPYSGTERPILSVDYEECKPDTYRGISINMPSGETKFIGSGNFETDIEDVEKFLSVNGIDSVLTTSSYDHYIQDVKQRRS